MSEQLRLDEAHEHVRPLTERIRTLAHCKDEEFDSSLAGSCIDEAIASVELGYKRRKPVRAPVNDFTSQQLEDLDELIKRFDHFPPDFSDDEAGEEECAYYVSLIKEAEDATRTLLNVRNQTHATQRSSRALLYIDNSNNQLNASGDVYQRKARMSA